ncbi:tetratricopeptide repeat protein [Flindersiella endophytica]
MFREIGSTDGKAATLDSLGYAHHHLGQYDLATSCYQRSLDLARLLGDPSYEAHTLSHLGDTQAVVGDQKPAYHSWRSALAIFEGLDPALPPTTPTGDRGRPGHARTRGAKCLTRFGFGSRN